MLVSHQWWHAKNLIFHFFLVALRTLVPFWPMMNFISDSTPFKTTETFCSTVDSGIVSARKRECKVCCCFLYFWSKWKTHFFQQFAMFSALTGIFVGVDTFGSTKLGDQSRFTNTWSAKHVNTIGIYWTKWSWWIRHGWWLMWWYWTICQTIASGPFSAKWIAPIDNTYWNR